MTVAPPRPIRLRSASSTEQPRRAASSAAYMPAPPAPITRTSLSRWLTVFAADIMALHERSPRGAPGNPLRRALGPHGRSRAGLRARQRLHPAARVCRGVRALLRAQSKALPPPRRFAAGAGAAALARRRPRHPHRRAALSRLPRRRAGAGRRRHPLALARGPGGLRPRLLVFLRAGAARGGPAPALRRGRQECADVPHEHRHRARRPFPRQAGGVDAAVQPRGRDPRNRDHLPLPKGARRASAPRPARSDRHRGPRAPVGGRSHASARGRAAAFLGLRHHAAVGGARGASVAVHHARAGPHAGDRPDECKPREPVTHESPIAETESLATIANHWLATFEKALAGGDDARLRTLFHPDSHWRDVLALTWNIGTVNGLEAVVRELKAHAGRAHPSGYRTDPRRTAPRHVTRAGTHAIEAIFQFETQEGRGNGVLRLLPEEKNMRAWTLLTALDEIKGFEERVGRLRPKGESYSRDFQGPNWLELRRSAAAYVERDPVVLVVGGGQAGLSIAARLAQLQVDTLIVDREQRIGDNWRNRYHALTLHNQVQVNHLPYMPFPPNWPTYIPKDKLANWFEAYVEAMELNYWTSAEFCGGSYDEAAGRWSVTLRREGTIRTLRPKHIVMATGVSGIPNIPDIPSLKDFNGQVLHSSQYRDGEDWSGKRAIVIGTGNSGHDIAQDLYSSGARVTLVQRSPTLIVNIEPSAQLAYTLYDEGPPLEDCDLLAASMPTPLVRKSHQALTEQGKELDKPLLDQLEQRGFKLDWGEDGTGWQFKYLTRGGGYYFNVGCSDLVAEGKVALAQFADVDRFVADGARRRDGSLIRADLVVLATGYKG